MKEVFGFTNEVDTIEFSLDNGETLGITITKAYSEKLGIPVYLRASLLLNRTETIELRDWLTDRIKESPR